VEKEATIRHLLFVIEDDKKERIQKEKKAKGDVQHEEREREEEEGEGEEVQTQNDLRSEDKKTKSQEDNATSNKEDKPMISTREDNPTKTGKDDHSMKSNRADNPIKSIKDEVIDKEKMTTSIKNGDYPEQGELSPRNHCLQESTEIKTLLNPCHRPLQTKEAEEKTEEEKEKKVWSDNADNERDEEVGAGDANERSEHAKHGVVVSFDEWLHFKGDKSVPLRRDTLEKRRAEKAEKEKDEKEKKKEKGASTAAFSNNKVKRKAAKQKDNSESIANLVESLEQEKRDYRITINFLRSECELVDAQKVMMQEGFEQLVRELEAELLSAHQKCLELETASVPSATTATTETQENMEELLFRYFRLLHAAARAGVDVEASTEGEAKPEVKRLYKDCRSLPWSQWMRWLHVHSLHMSHVNLSRPSTGADAE